MTPLRVSHARASVWLPQSWTVETLNHVAVVGAALLLAHFAKAFSDQDPHALDFALFYESVRSWRDGLSLYHQVHGLANYNPPQFHLLIVPLAWMPLPWAFIAWTAATAGAAVLTLRVAKKEAGGAWSLLEERRLFAGVLSAAGVGAAIHLGQVSWLIALIVTLGWRAARRDRWLACGAWLGAAASLKPFLLPVLVILVLRRRWSGLAAAAGGAALCITIGGLVFGVESLADWLRLLAEGAPRQQMGYFINASLAAPFARLGFGPVLYRVLGVIVVMVTVLCVRGSGIDRAFFILLTGSLLASPLGWIYYLPILAGPMIAMARNGELPGRAWCVWPLLACPAIGRDFLQFNRALAFTLGSAYTWGLVILWLAAANAPAPSAAMENTPASEQAAS